MKFENDKWNNADMEISQWLNGTKDDSGTDYTNIFKSTFLVFREKELDRLKKYCNSVFKFLGEKETRKLDESINFALEPNDDYDNKTSNVFIQDGKPGIVSKKLYHKLQEFNIITRFCTF